MKDTQESEKSPSSEPIGLEALITALGSEKSFVDSNIEDPFTRYGSATAYEAQEAKLKLTGLHNEIGHLKHKLKRYKSNTKNRVKLSNWAKRVVSFWLFGVFLILVFHDVVFLEMNTAVMCMLLGTTTVNVLGLMFIVLRGYFNEKEEDPVNVPKP